MLFTIVHRYLEVKPTSWLMLFDDFCWCFLNFYDGVFNEQFPILRMLQLTKNIAQTLRFYTQSDEMWGQRFDFYLFYRNIQRK